MPNITIMSWNIRTFGIPPLSPDRIKVIKDSILTCNVDILCIQEVAIGAQDQGNAKRIGTPIDPSIKAQLDSLVTALRPSNPNWNYIVSGRDKGRQVDRRNNMPDAYAFIYRADKIAPIPSCLQPEIIMKTATNLGSQVSGGYDIPIRKPGFTQLQIQDGGKPHLSIISWHSQYPNDETTFLLLRKLLQIGGGSVSGTAIPLPLINTVLLGDFNIGSGDPATAYAAYNSFTSDRSYETCIGSSASPVLTTYSPREASPPNRVSSYDNIFLLSRRTAPDKLDRDPDHSDAYDFIHAALAVPSGLPLTYYSLYKGENYSGTGVSDHLPVFQRFNYV